MVNKYQFEKGFQKHEYFHDVDSICIFEKEAVCEAASKHALLQYFASLKRSVTV